MVHAQCDTPKVWMGCLASYNAGKLHGEWIDLADGVDVFDEACAEILRTSPVAGAEELHGFDIEMMGDSEVGPGVCRRIAELFDEGIDADDWAARLVAADSLEDAVDNDPEVRPLGPFAHAMDAESAADDWIAEVFYEAIEAIDKLNGHGCHYASFDYEAARRDIFDIEQGPGGSWWAVERDA